jgi:ankyrin repeat protein
VELLLRAGAEKSTMSRSPIQDAAHGGRAGCLKLQLRAGADKDAKNGYGRMPLQLAVKNKHIKCRILLLRAGAIEVRKNESLCSAAAVGSTACVEQLPRAGTDDDVKDMYYKLAQVHYEAEKGHDICLKLVLRAGAYESTRDRHGSTPLHLAAAERHEKCAELLLRAGAEIGEKDMQSKTQLHFADQKRALK